MPAEGTFSTMVEPDVGIFDRGRQTAKVERCGGRRIVTVRGKQGSETGAGDAVDGVFDAVVAVIPTAGEGFR